MVRMHLEEAKKSLFEVDKEYVAVDIRPGKLERSGGSYGEES